MLVMSCLINMVSHKTATATEKFSYVISVFFLVVIIVFPIFVSVKLIRNFQVLKVESFNKKYGALYKELRLESGKLIVWEPLCFLLRRLILASTVICQR